MESLTDINSKFIPLIEKLEKLLNKSFLVTPYGKTKVILNEMYFVKGTTRAWKYFASVTKKEMEEWIERIEYRRTPMKTRLEELQDQGYFINEVLP